MCQSTSRSHTLPGMPWGHSKRALWGQKWVLPAPLPQNNLRAPGAGEREGRGGGTGTYLGETSPYSVLGSFPRRRQKCFKCVQWGGDRSVTTPPGHQPRLESMGTRARHQPRPARPTAAPSALAHVCVRVCPLLCRETVTVTQSKRVKGRRGQLCNFQCVMTASLLFQLGNSLF